MIGGTVNISRRLWDDEVFSAAPFSEREAWIWMIAEASWKPRKRRVGDYVVDLDRGQLAGSIRFFAKAWDWHPAKVQRFLDRIQRAELIRRKTDTGVTVITICKYDDFQSKPKPSDTDAIQVRYTSDTNENKGEIKIRTPLPPKGDDDGGSQSETFRERILSAMGADPVSGMIGASGKAIGRPWDMEHAAGWLRLGLSEAEVVKVIADICDGRSDAISSFKYFDQPMRRMAEAKAGTPAKAAAPEARPDRPKLPLVKVGEIEGRPVYGDPNNYGGDLTQQGLSQKARDILAAQAAQPKEANNG